MKHSWTTSVRQAFRENLELGSALAIELGLLCYAAFKYRHGWSANVNRVETVLKTAPILVLAAAPLVMKKRDRAPTRRSAA